MPRLTIVGCGWFGRPCARQAAAQGWEVRGSVRGAAGAAALTADGVEGFVLDLDDPAFPTDPFADAVVLVAVPAGLRAGRGEDYLRGVTRLLDHAARAGARALVLISSTSVYEGSRGDVDEATPPADPQGVLARAERHLQGLPLPTCAVRFGGLIGPGRHPGRFLAGREGLTGGGEPVNLVQQADCVAAVLLLLATPCAEWPACVNVVAPEHPPRAEFYPAAAAALGLPPPTFLPDPAPGGRVVRCRWLEAQGFSFSALGG